MTSHVSPFTSTTPIIIAGGGVIGLTLAQALTTAGIPFRLYERDTSISRAAGWGLTIHWALPALKSLIPPELFARFDTIQVDPEQGRKDTGRFVLLNIETLELVYVIPPAERQRIRRLGFRELLAEGVDINWGNAVTGFELKEGNEGVKVTLETGEDIEGSLLLGVDGSNSRIRRQLVGEEKGKLNYLPVTGCGTTVRLTPEEVKPLKAIDPLLFQGAAPSTGTFFWFSILSTPEVNGSLGTDDEYYQGQVNISWMIKDGQGAIPEDQKEKVKFMKHLAEPFHETLRKVINSIPDDALILEVKLADWPTQEWDNHDGRITLVGDAAHAMTMCE
jgi:2-polyprenyl-6-methoxyphenol hydroxylase-like FAD-dependent oxidoreductase